MRRLLLTAIVCLVTLASVAISLAIARSARRRTPRRPRRLRRDLTSDATASLPWGNDGNRVKKRPFRPRSALPTATRRKDRVLARRRYNETEDDTSSAWTMVAPRATSSHDSSFPGERAKPSALSTSFLERTHHTHTSPSRHRRPQHARSSTDTVVRQRHHECLARRAA
jgi:hypothetical protein